MLDVPLRRLKEGALAPVVRSLPRWVSPGLLTATSLGLSVAAGAAAWATWSWAAVAAWLAGRVLDGLDGSLARARGTADDRGGYVDVVADTVGYAVVPLGVALARDDGATWLAFGVMVSAFYVNAISWAYLAAVLEKRSAGAAARGELTSITMPPALVEGTETIVVYTVFLAAPSIAPVVFWIVSAGVSVGVVQRLVWARRHL